jgi:SAM-dependent methyltransferase
MLSDRYRILGRQLHRYPPPVSASRALALVERLSTAPGGTVLDVGCGTGGLLLDTVALHRCRGVGYERSPELAALARANTAAEGQEARIEIRNEAAREASPGERFDAILSLDAADSFGSVAEAAERCFGWLRVGGLFVLGEPFLRRTPGARYRGLLSDRLGVAAERLDGNGAAARAVVGAGFELLWTAILSEAEWDAYEGASYRAIAAYASQHAGDPEAASLRARAEAWYQGYWSDGRDTLAFGVHGFVRPKRTLALVKVTSSSS